MVVFQNLLSCLSQNLYYIELQNAKKMEKCKALVKDDKLITKNNNTLGLLSRVNLGEKLSH